MNQAMTKLLKAPESSYTTLQRVLLGLSSPGRPDPAEDVVFFDPTLNDSQKDAVRFALGSPEIALIHGPPGTGKTYTLIELILQFLKRDQRVLVCGPSNISVDNIVERLASTSPSTPIVRLGHPARLLPSVLNHSLEVLTRTSEAGGIVNDVRKEMDAKQASIRKTRNARERRAIYADLKDLRKEYRSREGKCIDGLVTGSKVVLSTLHGAASHQVRHQDFDVVVVDEASQALEPQCWVPLVLAANNNVKKLVLAGDHLQLPPTVKSADNNKGSTGDEKKIKMKQLEDELSKLAIKDDEMKAARKWTLETTLFDRLLAMHGPKIKRLLNVQYRMHEKIMRFPSDELYDSQLVAADAVKQRLLTDLPYEVQQTEDTIEPIVFFDTQGGDFPEKTEDDSGTHVNKSILLGDSKLNEMEAAVAAMHVKNLVNAGVRDEDIAVITPYNGQLAILSSLLKERYPNLELGSVDGFQGREKEAVVVSLVRSNAEKEVGFLSEKRRLNGKSAHECWSQSFVVSSCFLRRCAGIRHLCICKASASHIHYTGSNTSDHNDSCNDTPKATLVCDWRCRNSVERKPISQKMDEVPGRQCRSQVSQSWRRRARIVTLPPNSFLLEGQQWGPITGGRYKWHVLVHRASSSKRTVLKAESVSRLMAQSDVVASQQIKCDLHCHWWSRSEAGGTRNVLAL
jgi:DNA polymerase alpha-associated DNA helicase A